MVDHVCTFPDVEILQAEEGDILKKGDHVLGPCETCGETPFDHLEFMAARQAELEKALIAVAPYRPLYHWAPTARRKQIIRYGLRPSMSPTTNVAEGFKAPYICFADSPSWAWALSGQQRHATPGSWDLWMTYLNDLIEPVIHATPDRPSGLYEVRTEGRVFKRSLWYVGSRVK